MKFRNYTGYHETEQPGEDERLTHVLPGTPGGEYLRRFWQPVALETDVTDVPRLVRVLGENLILFRDTSGRYGLLHRHCAHRQASLEYGKCEAKGLRCCYHGWLFDVDGALLEAPAEPTDSPIFDKVRQPAYPVRICNGLIFAYLGPPETTPEFPVYDTFDLEDTVRVPYAFDYPCNWLQIIENAMDPVHSVFLHARVNGPSFTQAWGEFSIKRYYEDDTGFFYSNGRRVGDHVWVRMHHVIVPNMAQAGAVLSMTGDEPRYFGRPVFTRWVVPVDNENTRVIAWANFGPRSDAAKPEWMTPQSLEIIEGAEPRTRSRDEAIRKPGDYEAFVSMGPITRHAKEHLATSDKGVALFRRRLRNDIALVENGGEPARRRDPQPWPTYAGDTVLGLAKRDDDAAFVGYICDRVVEILQQGDEATGPQRDDAMTRALRDLELSA